MVMQTSSNVLMLIHLWGAAGSQLLTDPHLVSMAVPSLQSTPWVPAVISLSAQLRTGSISYGALKLIQQSTKNKPLL